MKSEYRSIRILGISIWKLFAYFILYSLVGYIIESIFGIVTKGIWESRQSFLYGPFLGIYGIGAIGIILFSQYFRKNNITLFIGGYIIGSVTEYLISFLVESILHTQWWDYSNQILNLNGRICLLYSIFWGVLTIFLIKFLHPKIDEFLKKIGAKVSYQGMKALVLTITIFLAINCLATCFAQDIFITRMVVENGIETKDLNRRLQDYELTKDSSLINNIWSNKKMIKTFPNMKIEDKEGNVIYLDSLLPEIKPYYLKVYEKK